MVGAYTEAMSDSNKKFPKGADFYYQKRHFYYKDWYWYFPEWLKYLIVALSISTTPFFVYLLYRGLDQGAYFLSLILLGLWIWSGVVGTANAWWMPERVTDHFKYGVFLNYLPVDEQVEYYPLTGTYDGVNRDIANFPSNGIALFLFIMVASPIWAARQFSWIFYFFGPFLIGGMVGIKLFGTLEEGFWFLFLIASSWPYLYGHYHIVARNQEPQDTIIDGINDRQRPASNVREDDESRNVQYDITQLCKKQLTLETWLYCMAIICVELLIINFS